MSFELISPILPQYSLIIEVDWRGKIVNSWHSNLPDFRFLSDAKIIVSISYYCYLYPERIILQFILLIEWLHVPWINL